MQAKALSKKEGRWDSMRRICLYLMNQLIEILREDGITAIADKIEALQDDLSNYDFEDEGREG